MKKLSLSEHFNPDRKVKIKRRKKNLQYQYTSPNLLGSKK
jgi:hypothetical protein